MCFDLDSRPPIAPIAGGALDSARLTLEASDGNRFRAFRARATTPTGAGMVVLPDVRGLHPFYEELALRLAENGIDALAIDYFGRTAGIEDRGEDFDYMPHVEQTTWTGVQADIRAAAHALRDHDDGRVDSLFTMGFCYRRPACLPDGDARTGAGRLHRLLRHPGRIRARWCAGAGRGRRPDDEPDPGHLCRCGPGDVGRGRRGLRRGADRRGRRAPAS